MNKPGQTRSPKPRKPRDQKVAVRSIGPISVTITPRNNPDSKTVTFDPSDFGCAEPLMRSLAQRWRAKYSRRSVGSARTVSSQLFVVGEVLQRHKVAQWSKVTVDHLKELEREWNAGGDGTSYGRWIYATIRKVAGDQLQTRSDTFLQATPAESRKRHKSTEALSPSMLKDVLRTAMHTVALTERRIQSAAWDGTSAPPSDALLRAEEVQAFYILLCMEWTQSPDVISSLSFDPDHETSVQNWHDNTGEKVTVVWFKSRAPRGNVQTLFSDQPWRAGALLRRLRDASAPLRSIAPPGWEHYPWAYAIQLQRSSDVANAKHPHEASPGEHWRITSILVTGGHKPTNFRSWCLQPRPKRWSINVDSRFTRDKKPDPLAYRTIRPSAKWAMFQATGKGKLLSELVDDNTIEVLSAYYLNSEVAMRDLAERWQKVPTIAEEIALGIRPIVLDRDGRVVVGEDITVEQAQLAIRGELSIGVSGCLNLFDSPQPGHEPGQQCALANRSCYFCPNSVVTPEDIPMMKRWLLLAENAHRALSPPEWALHWGRTVRWMTYVLPLMDPDWESLPIGDPLLFDLGLEAAPA